jgi:hypothetical protein
LPEQFAGARAGKGFVAIGQKNGALVAFSTEPGKTDPSAASEPATPGQTDLIMFRSRTESQ